MSKIGAERVRSLRGVPSLVKLLRGNHSEH
jgi:hypothetical protein